MRRAVSAVLLLGATTLTVAGEIPVERQQALLNLLKQDCGSCHGMTLKGGLGPSLLPEALAGKSRTLLAETIRKGRPDKAMPPWGDFISPDETDWLVQQLLEKTW